MLITIKTIDIICYYILDEYYWYNWYNFDISEIDKIYLVLHIRKTIKYPNWKFLLIYLKFWNLFLEIITQLHKFT